MDKKKEIEEKIVKAKAETGGFIFNGKKFTINHKYITHV